MSAASPDIVRDTSCGSGGLLPTVARVLAVMDAERETLARDYGRVMAEYDGIFVEHDAARATVVELVDELRKAHLIIGLALNCIEGEARRHFIDDVRAAGLEGEGVTRANERRALLERVEVRA